MSEFFKNLYTNFLLRDVLAKAVPGFLVLAYLFHGRIPTAYHHHGLPEIVVITVLYGLSFMTGMLLQFLGTLKICKRRCKWSLIKIYVHDDNQEKSLAKFKKFLNATKDRNDLRSQRERLVILKNMSGTYSIAVLIVALTEFIKFLVHRLDSFPFSTAILLILLVALKCQNRFHAKEQEIWENINIKGNDKANRP